MSVAAGRSRAGRTTRAGSTKPGRLGRAVGAARGLLGRAGARGGRGRRRGRGITRVELRGFRKIVRLLRSVGMVPKGMRHSRRAST